MDSPISAARVKKQKQYDVFLSFRGEDTRRGIVSHLHEKLRRIGLDDIFKDDIALELGDNIAEEIKEAIRNSKFAIVVLSPNFVSSKWCLEELRKIMKRHKNNQLVAVPIFYDVDPSHVRHQSDDFSLQRYESSKFCQFFSSEKKKMAVQVMKWKDALNQIGGTTGTHYILRDYENEAEMIKTIVKHINSELSAMLPLELGNLVGMDTHMEQITPLLDMDSTKKEVRVIGIWGLGGIGKTTIAKYLYNRYSPRFGRRCCFLRNVRFAAFDLPNIQKELLSKILGKEQATIPSEKVGPLIKSKLNKLKVFLVLDGVDHVDQLRGLAKETSWFGPGSRIIITTQDRGVLYYYRWRFEYHVKFMGSSDSIRLFKQVAFDRGQAPSDVYEQLSVRASKIAQGLPSALDVFATYLRKMTSIEEWEQALSDLEKFPRGSIKNIVRTSYAGLEKPDQLVFLQLACLFNGDPVQRVTSLIDNGEIRIKGILEKSLIEKSPDGCIFIHVLVEQVARDIVCEESKSKPWRQRFLWEHKQIISVLENNTGIATVEGMKLHMCDMHRKVSIKGDILCAINNLTFLKAFTHLNDKESKLQLLTDTNKLPETLRLLHWDAYPMTTLPSEYYPNHLIELNLRYSNLVHLWDRTQAFNQLKRLDVTGSKNLTEIPDLSEAKLLEELVMKGCTRLENTPESIGRLSCLKKLDLSNCDGLMNLQIYISEKTVLPEYGLTRRQQIILKLPGAVKKLSSLTNLSIEGKIHIWLSALRGNAEHLTFVPEQQIHETMIMEPREQPQTNSSFYDFRSLSIKRCSSNVDGASIDCISFADFSYLTELNLINLNILEIPEDIALLHSLKILNICGNDFKNLPMSMKNLSKLKYLNLSNCIKLMALPEMTDLQTLKLSGCSNIQSLLELPHVGRYSWLELELDNCKVVQRLSEQLSHFRDLIQLDLSGHIFEVIPESIRVLLSLGTLCINNCKKLKSLEELPLSLTHLYAHGCDSLENVTLSTNHSIKHLDLSHCFNLQQDEQLISQFFYDNDSQEIPQRFLCLPGTQVPTYFDNRSNGTSTKTSPSTVRPTSTVWPTLSLSFTACIMISCESSFHLQFPAFSYDWNYEADDETIRINLNPNLNLTWEDEEEEIVVISDHLVMIHVPSCINTDILDELRLESHLQLPEDTQPGEIRACGMSLVWKL